MGRMMFIAGLVVYSALTVGCSSMFQTYGTKTDSDVVTVKIEKTYWDKAAEFNAKHLNKGE